MAPTGPVAVDDFITTSSPVLVDVLANDTPSDGHDWQPTTLVISPPKDVNFTADVNSGLILVAPEPGFTGLASIGYVVTDSSGGTASATLTVTVPDTGPVPAPPGPTPTLTPDPTPAPATEPTSPPIASAEEEGRSFFAVVGSLFPWLLLLLLLAAIAYYLWRRYRNQQRT